MDSLNIYDFVLMQVNAREYTTDVKERRDVNAMTYYMYLASDSGNPSKKN